MKPTIPEEKIASDQILDVKFDQNDFSNSFLEKSRFSLLFSQSIVDIFKRDEKEIKNILKDKKVRLEIDYNERILHIRTTTKTRDPFIIIECKNFLDLIIRGVPYKEAKKIFQNNFTHIIFNLKSIVYDKKVLFNRRDRLIGKEQSILKGLRMLTDCFIQIEKKSVCAIGPYNKILIIEEFIQKSMENYHPVHLMKQLIAKSECQTDQNKKDMDWTNFIPKVTKKTNKKQQK
ncbi:rRNA processing protein [Pseudoloma neurophilia]|uniref:KRR-R motif-containing protein 1 n=1 Tax=Pseudoloma neurophilia TaxID=146866 RepID=A0A0R0M2I6_9MICR|nr:rRNA processing protein [Pseudoloma neurophilia]